MRVQPVDERDSHWEDSGPRFRVYIFRGGDEPMRSWSTATDDITDADVLEVVGWAREQAGGDGLFAVALVVEDRSVPEVQQRGLVWLVGTDANVGDPNEQEQRDLDAMVERREQYRRQHQFGEQ